jgi:hypothetical protein
VTAPEATSCAAASWRLATLATTWGGTGQHERCHGTRPCHGQLGPVVRQHSEWCNGHRAHHGSAGDTGMCISGICTDGVCNTLIDHDGHQLVEALVQAAIPVRVLQDLQRD